ncbi:uncharacterized protein HKW66_Vig0109240 [Vigna angularis]|uniref:STM1-like N-terminal domain-containing protein n=1 Tax=Phaseolus angularis TaxID=3914 RepID=A0A8T0KXQ5_PHAAN|nr:uncharacterized protein HKW66_Vig0109240 [Vigna angularis]
MSKELVSGKELELVGDGEVIIRRYRMKEIMKGVKEEFLERSRSSPLPNRPPRLFRCLLFFAREVDTLSFCLPRKALRQTGQSSHRSRRQSRRNLSSSVARRTREVLSLLRPYVSPTSTNSKLIHHSTYKYFITSVHPNPKLTEHLHSHQSKLQIRLRTCAVPAPSRPSISIPPSGASTSNPTLVLRPTSPPTLHCSSPTTASWVWISPPAATSPTATTLSFKAAAAPKKEQGKVGPHAGAVAQQSKLAQLPSKPVPPTQGVREEKNETSYGGRGGGRGGRRGYARGPHRGSGRGRRGGFSNGEVDDDGC